MERRKVILITGPTASGKTAMALQAAREYNTDILSSDSRQCYREMNIGVAKPAAAELAAAKHFFIDSHSIHDDVNAAVFEQYALKAVEEIFQKKEVAIVAGGTGLYIKAFVEGLDEIPEIPAAIREHIIQQYQQEGMEWLKDELNRHDPIYTSSGEMQNPQRMMRALEVHLATGRSIKTFQQKKKQRPRDFELIKYAIGIPREELYRNINSRTDRMMEDGLLEEVRSLLPHRNLNALQTVGYSELFEHLDGKISLGEAVEKIKMNTRHYAKRQLTWFRKDPEIKWIEPGSRI